MKNTLALSAAVICCIAPSRAQDWLSERGDPQRSGWQRYDRDLKLETVKGIKLLWQRQLEEPPNGVSGPILIGPTITHRGIKELVFVAGMNDDLYAVDADLGRLFWKRHIEGASPSPCGRGLTATPVLAPSLAPGPKTNDDDPGQMRPLYILSSDGFLHTIRISTGRDMAAPVKFTPPNANASGLNLASNVVYTATAGDCGGASAGVWSIRVASAGAKPDFSPGTAGGVSIGSDGTVFAGGQVPLVWKGRQVTANSLLADTTGGIATWEDAKGERWIYVVRTRKMVAYKLNNNGPTEEWTAQNLIPVTAPVIVNGIVFALTADALVALDAETGKELYTSGKAVAAFKSSNGLAVSNGHVCFTTSENMLYCFGLPIETQ